MAGPVADVATGLVDTIIGYLRAEALRVRFSSVLLTGGGCCHDTTSLSKRTQMQPCITHKTWCEQPLRLIPSNGNSALRWRSCQEESVKNFSALLSVLAEATRGLNIS